MPPLHTFNDGTVFYSLHQKAIGLPRSILDCNSIGGLYIYNGRIKRTVGLFLNNGMRCSSSSPFRKSCGGFCYGKEWDRKREQFSFSSPWNMGDNGTERTMAFLIITMIVEMNK